MLPNWRRAVATSKDGMLHAACYWHRNEYRHCNVIKCYSPCVGFLFGSPVSSCHLPTSTYLLCGRGTYGTRLALVAPTPLSRATLSHTPLARQRASPIHFLFPVFPISSSLPFGVYWKKLSVVRSFNYVCVCDIYIYIYLYIYIYTQKMKPIGYCSGPIQAMISHVGKFDLHIYMGGLFFLAFCFLHWFFLVLAAGGSWWLLVAPGGSWWLLVAFVASTVLVASVASAASVASVASVASMAPGSYGTWLLWLIYHLSINLSVKHVHQVHVVH